MENKTNRNLLLTLLLFWAIVIAYCDLLIPGLMMGSLACVFIWKPEIKLFGNEEETDEEES